MAIVLSSVATGEFPMLQRTASYLCSQGLWLKPVGHRTKEKGRRRGGGRKLNAIRLYYINVQDYEII